MENQKNHQNLVGERPPRVSQNQGQKTTFLNDANNFQMIRGPPLTNVSTHLRTSLANPEVAAELFETPASAGRQC